MYYTTFGFNVKSHESMTIKAGDFESCFYGDWFVSKERIIMSLKKIKLPCNS